MEEQKKTKKNENAQNSEQKKFTYEQVVDIANRALKDNQELRHNLDRAMQTIGMFNRIDYLFKVLQYEHVIKDPEFINNCVAEIKELLTLPTEGENTEQEG